MRQTDDLDVGRANALAVVLGLQHRFQKGDTLPPFFHQIYFWDVQPKSALGRDGHPRIGTGLIPETGLPRRMWAGGQLEFLRPINVSARAEKRSRCRENTRKSGRSGPLAFVTLEHEIWQNGQLCVRELQNLVYRSEEQESASKPKVHLAPEGAAQTQGCVYDSTMLFRYSALTFNGHRIHYDQDYTRDVEGYGDLVVHGPLLAQQLMLFAQDALGHISSFSFRNYAPLLVSGKAILCQAGDQFWIRDVDNRLIMRASANNT